MYQVRNNDGSVVMSWDGNDAVVGREGEGDEPKAFPTPDFARKVADRLNARLPWSEAVRLRYFVAADYAALPVGTRVRLENTWGVKISVIPDPEAKAFYERQGWPFEGWNFKQDNFIRDNEGHHWQLSDGVVEVIVS